MPKQDFEKTLKIAKICLLISGIRLEDYKWWYAVLYFIDRHLYIFNFVTLYTVIFGEVYWIVDGIQTGRSFLEMSLTAPCITISMLGTVKSLLLYLNRDVLVNVVEELKDIHPENEGIQNEIGDERELEIVKESNNFLKFVILLLSAISCAVMVLFCGTPVLLMGYDFIQTRVLTIVYPFLVKYFFDAYKSSVWGLIYFHQSWATFIVCVNLFGSDTLLYACCSYLAMHFRLLGLRFENVVSECLKDTGERLNLAVRRHRELIELVNKTEILYSKSMLFHIVTSSLLICLSTFNISVAKDFSTIFAFISFLSMSFSQISLLCFFGDMLMNASREVSSCVYKSRWYDVDTRTKKSLLIVMIRAQKPCRLTAANFADINLRAFTTILSRSWSYFALLKTVYN